jgi:predicted enzyme related to lactoylglutathione lyase
VSTVETAVGRFVWHEHHSADPKQAQDFYTRLLGWEIEVWKPGEFDYGMISSGGAMHGGFGSHEEAPPHWMGHVRVESADETAEKAKAAGGRIVAGPMSMPEVGRFAVIADPQGAVFSAFQPEGDMPPPAGVFVWDELVTEDLDAATKFYGDVLGWTARDMGQDFGGYRIFSADGTDVAGAMTKPADAPVSAWLVYVGVDDVDATAAKAKELGGRELMAPMDIPTVGRISVLQDPQGAVFGLFKPSE